MPNSSYSASFWTSVANRFKNNGMVIFDLFNEPIPNNNANDGTDTGARRSWECWRDGYASGSCDATQNAGTASSGMTASQVVGMQALLNAVRATGATNVVQVNGIQWGNTIWSSSTRNFLTYKLTDPLNNTTAAMHTYNWTWCPDLACLQREVAPIAAVLPVFIGEFGHDACGTSNRTALIDIMRWADSKGVGYAAQTWDTTDSCSNIKLLASFDGTPGPYGDIIRDHYLTFAAP